MSWLLGGLAILGLFVALHIYGEIKHRRMARAMLRRRPNPTKVEFITMLAASCDPTVAEFLWDELLVYFRPTLTPHPDDEVFVGLPIDHEEVYDWQAEFGERFGLADSALPDWPEGQPGTVRNIASWLASGLHKATTA